MPTPTKEEKKIKRDQRDTEIRAGFKLKQRLHKKLETEKQEQALNKADNKKFNQSKKISMSKSFASSIKKAATGTGMDSLIPTGNDEDLLKQTKQEIEHLEKNPPQAIKGRKPRPDKDNKTASAAEKGTKPGEMRKTYLVDKQYAEDIEAVAYWERLSIKDVINAALASYINEYALDSKHNANVLPSLRIKPIPVKQ